VEDCSADEASEHNHYENWGDKYVPIETVGYKLVVSQSNENNLQHEGKNHMHSNIQSFLLLDLECTLLRKLLSLQLRIDFSLSIIISKVNFALIRRLNSPTIMAFDCLLLGFLFLRFTLYL
jgi:hypothetical protein